MRHSVSRDLYTYWNRLRGARSAPDRSDIDPAAIRHVLADSFIVEIEPSCRFPIRLCGTRLNALWLSDQKGNSFLDLWRSEDRRSVAAALLTVIDGATPIVAGALAHAPGVDQHQFDKAIADVDRDLNFELLLLPLRHFGKTHSRLLGSLSSSNQTPWLGHTVASKLYLKSLRIIRAQEPQAAPSPTVYSSRGAGKRPPLLVVHEGGKARM
ncbi:MAG: PAS domain-containing protein [Methylocystis sp.]